MSQDRSTKRVIRRETHSSRAGLAVVVAVLVMLTLLWLAVESVLSLLGQNALLISPGQLAAKVAALPEAVIPAALIASGVVVALIGLLIFVAAITGGRRARRAMGSDRVALVVDDDTIAAAISRKVRLTSNLAPEQVTTSIGRSSLSVRIRPTSGVAIDRDAVLAATKEEVAAYRLGRTLRTDVHVAAEGVLGR